LIAHSDIKALMASEMPVLTSALVGLLTAPSTLLPDSRTASVFVPPTSTPIRIETLQWTSMSMVSVRKSLNADR
jgi:hypothetical protein